jgi:hypothetical protein
MEPGDGVGAATQEADGAQNACASPEQVEKLLHDGVMKDPRVSPDISFAIVASSIALAKV